MQSAHFIERMHRDPTEQATFFGMEKNPTTIRLANMNLAVHGLEGNIHKAALRDVEGLVKLVDHDELAANDWSLTPGRYVGVAPEEDDEDFDFAQTMRDIHSELDVLNAKSVQLAATIKRNFEALGL